MTDAGVAELDAHGRPTAELPRSQLLRMSLYWFGLSSIFAAVNTIFEGRLQFGDIPIGPGEAGRALFLLSIGGAVVAILVQPTIGSISDYTISRWGRRKPYIVIGTVLDLVFLFAIASSNSLLALAVFVMLLQFSSNFAQGPFQGYVPDLVPARQVGLASALVGLLQILGNVAGFAVGAIAIATDQFFLGTMAVGIVEFITMLGVFFWVQEGRTPKAREGRPWRAIALEAWGTDILRERSFLWLVASRLFVLMAGALLVNLKTFYLARAHGLNQAETGSTELVLLAIVAAMTIVSVVPSARLSDRLGRKKVIYGSCVIGAAGMSLVALAETVPVALAGAAVYGLSAGIFLAVDWALMTDIIPKASSGRYMGMSNVATASSGVLAIAFGGLLMDVVGGSAELGSGPRAAMWFGVVLFVFGALFLRPVDERRREDVPIATPVVPDPRAGAAGETA